MHIDDDFMEYGDSGAVALEDGWFLDIATGRRFIIDEEGERVDEDGNEMDLNDDNYYEDEFEQYGIEEWA